MLSVLGRVLSHFTHSVHKVPTILLNAKHTVDMAKKTAILLIADGSEEMEAVITADVLRRAGIDVTLAGLTDAPCIKCSRDVKICADTSLKDAVNQKYDVVILPGGLGGSKAFASSAEVGKLLQQQEKEDRVIAAICAAPTALKAHGIAKGKQLTSYPSMKDQLTDEYKYLEDKVVTDGNLITSRGPATAFAFGLAIVEKLLDKDTANNVAKGMLYTE
ncbi:protein dj-1beta-like [Hylaeus anthracinus]|uniref:protein dj-1beta-like n=1 Tax=Hylaeus volcanicus TaxID=313075 RepID=UPI0023B7E87C|nr:protein dj-1beta-like [Hylaeus volcanicus]XP_054008290.1 protein dj-1beta-like [Hylaeus anthracinus]